MEKFMQRENFHVGYGKSPRSSDAGEMDFNDVFGGPPRRYSMQDVRARYSFGEAEEDTGSSPWKEKPVFGEERRRKGTDFFDDIFKGVERDRDGVGVFGSNPGSRIISPKADLLATSLPASAQFSSPAKLNKGMDLPTFGGEKRVDGVNNGFSSPQHSWSRFSNEANRIVDDSNINDVHPLSRRTPSSNQISSLTEKDGSNVDSIDSQFHFSIYKWAGRGLMPLVIGNNLKSNENLKSASSNGRMERKSPSVRRRGSSPEQEDVTTKQEQSESKSKSSPEKQVKSVDESNVGEKIKSRVKKPLHAFLVEGDQPGETKEKHESNKVKEKAIKKGVESRVSGGKSAASKGKVKEFVQIFNHEADVEGRRGIDKKGVKEVSSNTVKVKQEAKPPNVDKKPDVPFKVAENLKNDEAQQGFYPTKRTTTRSSSTLRRSFSAGAQHYKDLKLSPDNLDDPLEGNFVVQEISDGQENAADKESTEDTKAIDAKIRQWSVGKKGNIRSLLSTLQYVLWAESGWKAVPLVDLIEATSVKRAYQKALLRLHPDKLQQKGAAFHQKYTAEKVFDILQEAWDHFNTCSSLGL